MPTDYNPVGAYIREFTVPAGWEGMDVFLDFEGVESAYYVWVNGELAGYAEDSRLPSHFNITKLLKKGNNRLAVKVFRYSDGLYLEGQTTGNTAASNGVFISTPAPRAASRTSG